MSRFHRVLYGLLDHTVAPALRAVYRPETSGAPGLPADGPVIFAGNHVSFADEVFLAIMAGRPVSYLAKAEYFTSPGLRGRAMAAFFSGLGQVPVERGDARAAAASIDVGVEVLRSGHALGIFPEGTRSPDGRLYRFRTGVARVALRSGAPVVPVALVGTRQVLPPGSKRWRRAPVAVHFGPPLRFDAQTGGERSAKVLRAITDEIREHVQRMGGQEYVDAFATSAAKQ